MAGFCKEKIEDLVPDEDFCTICKKVHLHEAFCEMRSVSCKFCRNFVVYSQVITHEMNCHDRYITECKECILNFNSVIEATTHRCPREIVDCNLCAVDCCSAMCPGHFMRCEIDEKCASPSQTAKMVAMIFLLKQQLTDTLSDRRSESVSIDGESSSNSSSNRGNSSSSSSSVINYMAGGKRLREEASDTICSSGGAVEKKEARRGRPRKKTSSAIDANVAASMEEDGAICDKNATTSQTTDTTVRWHRPDHVISELMGSNDDFNNSSMSDSYASAPGNSSFFLYSSSFEDPFFTPTYWPDEYPEEEEEERDEEKKVDDISGSTPNRMIGSPTGSHDNKVLVPKSCDVSVFGVSVNSRAPQYHVVPPGDYSDTQSTTSSPTNSPPAPKIRKKSNKKKVAVATMTLKEKTELKNREAAQKIAQSIQPIYKSYIAAVVESHGGVMQPPVNNGQEELVTFSPSSAHHHQEERGSTAHLNVGGVCLASVVSSCVSTTSSTVPCEEKSIILKKVLLDTTNNKLCGVDEAVPPRSSSNKNCQWYTARTPPESLEASSSSSSSSSKQSVHIIKVKEEEKEEVFVIKAEECDMMV